MQQLSRFCMIADHNQRQIEYVCMYPECNLNRFACGKCVKIGNHKHQKEDQSHVLDSQELCQFLQERLSKSKSDVKLKSKELQRIIHELHKLVQNIRNMIEQIEQSMDQNYNGHQLNELILNVRNHGLSLFNDIQLNMLINIDKQAGDIYNQLSDQSNHIIQNVKKIKELCYSQQIDNSGLAQIIIDSNHNLITQDQVVDFYQIYSATISNDLKYIVWGGNEQKIKIWNYSDNKLIKSIQLDDEIKCIKFTEDSKLLYLGKQQELIQFDVNNNFKETYKQAIHSEAIVNIICINNTIILTSSIDKTIIKTDINLKQQLLLIKAHNDRIDGLDYNHNLNMIASTSHDKSIRLWNGNNGSLVLEKQNAHNNKCDCMYQVLFIIKQNQLISLDNLRTIIIWNINCETKQLEQQQLISDNNTIYNISLVLNQQYVTLVCKDYIKIYSVKGDYIRQFNHDVQDFYMFNCTQPQPMKAIMIQGKKILQICKIDII